MKKSILFLYLVSTVIAMANPETIPPLLADMIYDKCSDCHDDVFAEANINLDMKSIDWTKEKHRDLWLKVLKVTKDGIMPPLDKDQPSLKERSELIAYLDKKLIANTKFGKASVRRLSNREYQKKIQTIFNYPDFKLKDGFPADHLYHGFDNQAKGLQISAPLMHAYVDTANSLADWYFYHETKPYKPLEYYGGPSKMTQTFSSSEVRDNGKTLRLASRHAGSVFRACSWSSDLEIKTSGEYNIEVSSSMFKPKDNKPMVLELRARSRESSDRTYAHKFRILTTFEVNKTSPETFKASVILHEGETIMFRWANSEFDHTPEALIKVATDKFKKDPRYLAAWLEVAFPKGTKIKGSSKSKLRGLNGHLKIAEAYKKKDLNVSDAHIDSARTKDFFAHLKHGGNSQLNYNDTWAHYIFENGPSLQVHGLRVTGPTKVVDSLRKVAQTKRRLELLGERKDNESDLAYAKRFIARFLPKAYNTQIEPEMLEYYNEMAEQQLKKGTSFDESMHFVLRAIIKSPRFIFRDLNGGSTEYNLASRLSYFLSSGPPDAKLMKAVANKSIMTDAELEAQVKRLLPKRIDDSFVQSFPEQWLNTHKLKHIMPDAGLKFSDDDVKTARLELHYFFLEILKKNLQLKEFIDPDFCFTKPSFAKKFYGLKTVEKGRYLKKMTMPRGHRHGGLLGMSSIMTATANGVDTEAVLRGVWFIENIIGRPTPAPPSEVPSIPPDTEGSHSPRDKVIRHTNDPKCSGCHQMIDPFGFAFENFNAVGVWRDKWPKYNIKIDPRSKLFDGTQIAGHADMKKWLVKNIDMFGQCLAEKLMTYALGRAPNYREQAEIKSIVQKNLKNKEGFQDLIIDLVKSQTFKAQEI